MFNFAGTIIFLANIKLIGLTHLSELLIIYLIYLENRFGLHRHIQCRPGQQPLQACPEGALQKLRLIEERYG